MLSKIFLFETTTKQLKLILYNRIAYRKFIINNVPVFIVNLLKLQDVSQRFDIKLYKLTYNYR